MVVKAERCVAALGANDRWLCNCGMLGPKQDSYTIPSKSQKIGRNAFSSTDITIIIPQQLWIPTVDLHKNGPKYSHV